ncbi:Linker_histone domain-containing protein [Cephalotus follicularis]|uniref:Linker_histone domain-containing protein n=1 Tax=Cephalotus follicularis TaxID=3775 RepID=A0A1Q3C258_CEPFO|nr:Linker_histone domain-containing protein [Cephalotus follicularis]
MATTTASKAKKLKGSPSHPPFLQMITEAIVALKEKTGSSQYAITKFTEEKQKQLPANFRKLLLVYLKRLVASGKLVKVKNSFKLPPYAAAKPKAVKPKPKTAAKPKAKAVAPKPKVGEKRKAAVKPKPKPTKVKKLKSMKSPAKTTPGKKAAAPKKVPAAAKVKKLKSVKSPAKKATVKKAKK